MADKQKSKTGQPKPKSNAGRPTKLTRELTDRARRYIDVETMHGGLYHGDLPMVASLAMYLDVSRDSCYEWAKQETPLGREFSDILEKISATQEYKLVGKSLKGEYNSTIAKMLLSSKHGYVERTQVDEKSEQTVTVITRSHDD